MCKNKLFQNLGTKNELFKVQGRKTKLMYNLGTKTIFWPKIYKIHRISLKEMIFLEKGRLTS